MYLTWGWCLKGASLEWGWGSFGKFAGSSRPHALCLWFCARCLLCHFIEKHGSWDCKCGAALQPPLGGRGTGRCVLAGRQCRRPLCTKHPVWAQWCVVHGPGTCCGVQPTVRGPGCFYVCDKRGPCFCPTWLGSSSQVHKRLERKWLAFISFNCLIIFKTICLEKF